MRGKIVRVEEVVGALGMKHFHVIKHYRTVLVIVDIHGQYTCADHGTVDCEDTDAVHEYRVNLPEV